MRINNKKTPQEHLPVSILTNTIFYIKKIYAYISFFYIKDVYLPNKTTLSQEDESNTSFGT